MAAAEPEDALAAALRIAAVLDAGAIPYALGGALAYGLWGVPRGTVDVDLNVFVPNEGLESVFEALEAAGVSLDRARALAGARDRGQFEASLGSYRVDVFTPSIDFAWEAQRTRVAKSIGGQRAWFLSAEALAVFKLLFFRPKDIVDLERLVAVQGGRLDHAYVRRWLADMMGAEDERVKRWDSLVEEHAG